jgi:transketolase
MESHPSLSATNVRRIILEQAYRAHVGHIGSALSIVDILVALYSHTLQIPSGNQNERDRLILSNGHTSLALYAVLCSLGILPEDQIQTFCEDDSYLGVHPEYATPGIDFTTGSLGQGLSIGAGCALAARVQNSSRRVFVLLSDAGCNEGSVWEAVMFAAHNRLSNLTAIIDLNGQQAMGYTENVMNLTPMAERWKAFQWNVHEVDGNNQEQIVRALNAEGPAQGQPRVVIAHTVFGKGVSFMEGQIKWHYWPLSAQEFQQALDEINAVQ